ncbi:TPA: hypothetical protein DEP34_04830 [Candidatus Uhrbacteria bacterium]|uniref:Uncharacterized protein n=2 Tax=Candidatus Uhriibacteriota TaxID=1752732 RepID=A0A0G1T649_9BACT|nr:MAG: hypothetical protein UX45_C0006G0027 [Candidatus Uhrbacteria bacterium GW2011_GWF2_46_218]KKU40860.1 MAG: hypothetical protein UX57_C0009G0027 [Candidatus Uhrbacteria bacterium GW2011_GWE2_46_68]HBK33907.1 hypothetical protein [Candidatus Uhrbacteria bacterium]HCB19668.1 hypothetical protein [Candidatus Uhrbacteria bacterium]
MSEQFFSHDMPSEKSAPASVHTRTLEQPPVRIPETSTQVEQDIDRCTRVVSGMKTLLERASSGASLRTASLLRIGSLLIALGAGTAGSLREAHADTIHYPDVGGIDIPEGGTIDIYPDQRLEAAQDFLQQARSELIHLQEQEESLRGHEENPDVAYVMRQRLRENLRRQQHLISMIVQKEALVDQLSQTLEDQEIERVEGLMERAQTLREKGRGERAEILEEKASIRLYGTANTEIDVYMASIGVREEGRKIAMYDEAGTFQVFVIAPGLQPNGFYRDARHDTFTIVLKSPTNYYGFFLKEGKLYAHGVCTEQGRPLHP